MLHRHPVLSLVTGVYLVFVAWLTLSPQPIGGERRDLINRVLAGLHRRGYVEFLDFTRLEFWSNIALFVPIGMFLLLLLGAERWWAAALLAFAMTVFIESAQTRIPGRVPDDRDLVANGAGAVIGIAVAVLITLPATLHRRRRRRRMTPREPVHR